MKLCIEKTRMDDTRIFRVYCISCRQSFTTTLRGHCLTRDGEYDLNIGKRYMFYCPHCDFIFVGYHLEFKVLV